MSNSGKIGGSTRSAKHTMHAQKQKLLGIDGNTNRASRRAYVAMAKKNKPMLDKASKLAVDAFDGDAEKAKAWLYEQYGEYSPIERILTGQGQLVIEQLKDMLKEKSIQLPPIGKIFGVGFQDELNEIDEL